MAHVKYKLPRIGGGPSSPEAAKLRESLFALKVVCHPVRLRIILRLADGAIDTGQLKAELRSTTGFLSSYLAPLLHRGLVKGRQRGNHKVYALTEVGLKTVRYDQDTFGAAWAPEAESPTSDSPSVSRRGPREMREHGPRIQS